MKGVHAWGMELPGVAIVAQMPKSGRIGTILRARDQESFLDLRDPRIPSPWATQSCCPSPISECQ